MEYENDSKQTSYCIVITASHPRVTVRMIFSHVRNNRQLFGNGGYLRFAKERYTIPISGSIIHTALAMSNSNSTVRVRLSNFFAICQVLFGTILDMKWRSNCPP